MSNVIAFPTSSARKSGASRRTAARESWVDLAKDDDVLDRLFSRLGNGSRPSVKTRPTLPRRRAV